MASQSLLSNLEIDTFTGIYAQHFDTFSYSRTRLLQIHKEPTKTLVNAPAPAFYGYGQPPQAQLQNFVLTPVSGIYPVVVNYEKKQNEIEIDEVKNTNEDGKVRIKVEKNCRDFIEDGKKNEKFVVDGNTFNQITSDNVQSFLGLKYYLYTLERTD